MGVDRVEILGEPEHEVVVHDDVIVQSKGRLLQARPSGRHPRLVQSSNADRSFSWRSFAGLRTWSLDTATWPFADRSNVGSLVRFTGDVPTLLVQAPDASAMA